ncbi:MAG TPA: PHP domain-containing protein [bacterium]|nr:PHP domain-containing protein [bacterium]HPJ71144.1 PHP domain-containing protein [bacterium]
MKPIDLHLHTTASDGAFTVEEVLTAARDKGLAAISITDHDSVSSVPEEIRRSSAFGLEAVPGMELSIECDGFEIHLLGYLFDYRDAELLERLSGFQEARRERAELMLAKLEGMGITLELEKYFPGVSDGSIGRLHIGRAMYLSGYVSSVQEAFSRYIGNQGPVYVPKLTFSLPEAIGIIRKLGGVAVLAHPGQLRKDDLIPEMVSMGLQGLEAYYPSHSLFETNHYIELARYYGLIVTGGSDCHGPNKSRILMGEVVVPYEVLDELRELVGK